MKEKIKGAITRVPGFQAAGVACGVKDSGQKDLGLIVAEQACTAAAVFTKNSFQAAPVLYDRALLERTSGEGLRAVLTNSGNANACTGEQGGQDAIEMACLVQDKLNLSPDSVFVMSTGIIGQHLPMDKIAAGMEEAGAKLGDQIADGIAVAEAIMTTDLVSKEAFAQVKIDGQLISIGGIAKGSGMIHPDMATMLATLVTDAKVKASTLNQALKEAVDQSFNCISVDGDTSTNDTVVILASGTATEEALGGQALEQFTTALTEVCIDLAKQIARDGEGATKLVQIQVSGATSDADAVLAAKTVAISPLVKTAIFGNDPNWGRIFMALGRSGAQIEPTQADLWMKASNQEAQLVAKGEPLPFDTAGLSQAMHQAQDVDIVVDLGLGDGKATYWTCDFSYEYVEINAEYHT